MTTLWTDLYPNRLLLQRSFVAAPGVTTITAPPRTAIIRASAVGAGGWSLLPGGASGGGFGGGAAFARVKLAATPGQQFSIQVGDPQHSFDAGDALGDTKVTRVSDSAVLLRAARGSATAGLAANSLGDTTRSGAAPTGTGPLTRGGISAGDDVDPFSLGFGGRGGGLMLGPVAGGGGAWNILAYQAPSNPSFKIRWTIPPGPGRCCIEFFSKDPGYP